MVQPVDIGFDGKARACRVHDMMLELIISKSAEENFITVINSGQTVWETSNGYIRRLSIQHIDQDLASVLANKDLRHVRSLTVTDSDCIKHLPSLVQFETLRVLDFEGCEGLEEYDMNGIDNLFHLKYLSFRGTGISGLPPGVPMLQDLETLDLRNTDIQELPTGIVELVKLQYLLTARDTYGELEGNTKIPDGIGNMRSLRAISGFNITLSSKGAVEELGNLTSLNHLHVELNGRTRGTEEYKEMLLSSLCKLGACELRSLEIYSDEATPLEFLDSWSPLPSSLQLFNMDTTYYLPRPPKWITPALTSLSYLDINLFEVTEEDLRRLGKLCALLSLEVWSKCDPKERLTIQGLPSLKEFVFVCRDHDGGAYVAFAKGAMPKLEKLELPFHVSMATLYGLCFGIGHLPCLKEAEVHLYSKRAKYSETKAATAVIRNEAAAHPNHPKVTIHEE